MPNSYKTIEHFYKETEHEIAKMTWSNDEELYNITGYYYNGTDLLFDPLNCNMYNICKQCKTKRFRYQVSQRVCHLDYKLFEAWQGKNSSIDLISHELKKILLKLSQFILDKRE